MTRGMWAYALGAVLLLGGHGLGASRGWFRAYREKPIIDLRGMGSGGGGSSGSHGGGSGFGGFRGGK